MLNSYEILWVTVIYNIIILFNKTNKEIKRRKIIKRNTDNTVDWTLYKEDKREDEREYTGLTNWELTE
jgi:hypothetical protein